MDTVAMPQAPVFFFTNDSKTKTGQPMSMYPTVPTLPSTPMYSRPGSSCSQPPTLLSNGPSVMTPTGSPPPTHHRPAIMLETEFGDNPYFPSTPPLSTSGSAIGSPKSCDVLQTPMNPMFSGLDGLAVVKPCLESAENSVLDWSSCGSPPMTPGELKPSRPSIKRPKSNYLVAHLPKREVQRHSFYFAEGVQLQYRYRCDAYCWRVSC